MVTVFYFPIAWDIYDVQHFVMIRGFYQTPGANEFSNKLLDNTRIQRPKWVNILLNK